MPGNLVEEFLQAESPLLDELRLEDAVVAGDEGKLLGEGLARQGGHHDLNCPGQLISQPLHPQYKLHILPLIYIYIKAQLPSYLGFVYLCLPALDHPPTLGSVEITGSGSFKGWSLNGLFHKVFFPSNLKIRIASAY